MTENLEFVKITPIQSKYEALIGGECGKTASEINTLIALEYTLANTILTDGDRAILGFIEDQFITELENDSGKEILSFLDEEYAPLDLHLRFKKRGDTPNSELFYNNGPLENYNNNTEGRKIRYHISDPKMYKKLQIILGKLSYLPYYIRSNIAQNTKDEMLIRFLQMLSIEDEANKHPESEPRQKLCINPNCPNDILDYQINNFSNFGKTYVLRNPIWDEANPPLDLINENFVHALLRDVNKLFCIKNKTKSVLKKILVVLDEMGNLDASYSLRNTINEELKRRKEKKKEKQRRNGNGEWSV